MFFVHSCEKIVRLLGRQKSLRRHIVRKQKGIKFLSFVCKISSNTIRWFFSSIAEWWSLAAEIKVGFNALTHALGGACKVLARTVGPTSNEFSLYDQNG